MCLESNTLATNHNKGIRRISVILNTMLNLSWLEKLCSYFRYLPPISGMILDISSWDPSVSKFNRLHVDMFRWFFFINLRFILHIPLKCSVIFLNFSTSIGHFSNSTGSSLTLLIFPTRVHSGTLKFEERLEPFIYLFSTSALSIKIWQAGYVIRLCPFISGKCMLTKSSRCWIELF